MSFIVTQIIFRVNSKMRVNKKEKVDAICNKILLGFV